MAEIPDRLTVVEYVYHQQMGREASMFESRFSRALGDHEQPYERQVTVGEDWQSLDCGWVERVGMLVLRNEEGRHMQLNPTAEERRAIAGRVVEIRTKDQPAAWLVHPGESLRACPADAAGLEVRCQAGEARVTIHAIPG